MKNNPCTQGFPVFREFSDDFPREWYDPAYAGGRWQTCPNLKTVNVSWESETIACSVCGHRYTLYDDEMR